MATPCRMANVVANPFLLLFIVLPSFFLPSHGGHTETSAATKFSQRVHMELKEEKMIMTHLHLYFHDTVSGRNKTVVAVTAPRKPVPSLLGHIHVVDDLTEGPAATSRLVGRAQGFYAAAALDEMGFLQAMNLVFNDGAGEYDGSMITVLGRNAPFHDVREMPVVGRSGRFRFAWG